MNAETLFPRIGLVGCGAMGQGIAQLAACSGRDVHLFDTRLGAARDACERIAYELARQVERGRLDAQQVAEAMERLHPVDSLEALAECALVVEAIVEDLAAKQTLFRQLEGLLDARALIVSNTSSLSITAIAAACRDPGRVAGLHFFNPVPRMRLVEVVPGLMTRGTVVERLLALVHDLGHQPVRVQDAPGFLVNHAGRAYGTEALRILAEGVATPEQVDALLRDGAGFPMGPFELMDLVGLDVSVPVMESIYHQYYEEPRYRPHPLARQRLAAGHLGRKSGRGFHAYPGRSRCLRRCRRGWRCRRCGWLPTTRSWRPSAAPGWPGWAWCWKAARRPLTRLCACWRPWAMTPPRPPCASGSTRRARWRSTAWPNARRTAA